MATTVERPSRPRVVRAQQTPDEQPVERESFDFTRPVRLPTISAEQVAWISLVALAFVMRIWDLGSRALHHDESMHAFYGWQLFKGLGYHYDPMLHGPFQFHANALMMFLFG